MPGANPAEPDAKEFERVYLAHFASVRSFLRIFLGNVATAEDLTQDTFLQIWSRPSGFDPSKSSVRAYLFGIARKKAADWWRHHAPNAETAAEPVSSHPVAALALKDALQLLPPDLRNVLWLREVEGYSYDELAMILDVPLGTVKSRLFAAREQLRRIWRTT
jgi:RNA polymerase sigma-70 factor (ECF subfamily)